MGLFWLIHLEVKSLIRSLSKPRESSLVSFEQLRWKWLNKLYIQCNGLCGVCVCHMIVCARCAYADFIGHSTLILVVIVKWSAKCSTNSILQPDQLNDQHTYMKPLSWSWNSIFLPLKEEDCYILSVDVDVCVCVSVWGCVWVCEGVCGCVYMCQYECTM